MYIWERAGLGEKASANPRPLQFRMRRSSYLKLMVQIRQTSLTPRLADMVNKLADTVIQSWNSRQPIEIIRLIGHTDSTGPEKYNVGLGDRRANTVAAPTGKLKGLPAERKSRRQAPEKPIRPPTIARRRPRALTAGSKFSSNPQSSLHRNPSRRSIYRDVKPPQEPVIRTKREPYWNPIPPGAKGKSFKEWLDDKLKIPRSQISRDKIWQAIFDKDWDS